MVADELWVAEKFQSNPEIAGSLRNSFRASLEIDYRRESTELARGREVTEPYQTKNAG